MNSHCLIWKFNRKVCDRRRCFSCTLAGKRPPQLWRYTGLLEKVLKKADIFISPSRFSKRKHHELGLDIPITHIPYFLPEPKKNINGEHYRNSPLNYPPNFLFVGRLEKIKGLQYLIPLFKKHHEFLLLIAGEGGYGEVLRALAGDSPNIEFLGRLDYKRLQQLYSRATAVIVPSICYEVSPVIIYESFASKTPVIANNLGGMPEMIRDSGGGFIYNNEDELLGAIKKLAGDPNLREELGKRGYQAYLKYWTEDRHMEKYFNLIKTLQKKRYSLKEGKA